MCSIAVNAKSIIIALPQGIVFVVVLSLGTSQEEKTKK
jgi:hypothetical protein